MATSPISNIAVIDLAETKHLTESIIAPNQRYSGHGTGFQGKGPQIFSFHAVQFGFTGGFGDDDGLISHALNIVCYLLGSLFDIESLP